MTASTSKSRKAKGREFQQKIRADLIENLGLEAQDIVSTPMGQAGCDIYLALSNRNIFPFGVECKNQEALNIWESLKQCQDNAAKEKLLPLLVLKRNHTEPYAVLRWRDFLTLYSMVLIAVKQTDLDIKELIVDD